MSPAAQTVNVYYEVAGIPNAWSSYTDGSTGWMTYDPPDGITPEKVTVTLNLFPESTLPGTHSAEIRFGANVEIKCDFTCDVDYKLIQNYGAKTPC